MEIFLYSTSMVGQGRQLLEQIKKLVPELNILVCRNLERLEHLLREPGKNGHIVIVLAGTREELKGVLTIRELLDDIQLILVLPDGEKETVADGLKLHPRFTTVAGNDFFDVAAVLGKMLEKAVLKNNFRKIY